MRYRLLGIALVAFSLACNNDHSLGDIVTSDGGGKLDVAPRSGWVDARMLPSVDASAPGASADAQDPNLASLVGSWTGYIENYQFVSGSDTIKLTFEADAFGTMFGHVVFGVGTPPPPATDPNIGYPAGLLPGDPRWLQLPWLEGFPFTVFGANLAGERLRFSIKGNEPWTGWCELQPPSSDGSPACVPNGTGSFDINSNYCLVFPPVDPTPIQFDCGKLWLCLEETCICDASGCAAYIDPVADQSDPRYGRLITPPMVSFDMFISSGIASGSVSGAFSDNNVHFIKDPE